MIQGVIAGNFDIIHPGYIKMFKECKQNCDNFIILLQTDPTIERPEKLKPILSIQERIETLNSIKYIDMVVKYTTESDLIGLLKFLKTVIITSAITTHKIRFFIISFNLIIPFVL